jgi:hypothetical protein
MPAINLLRLETNEVRGILCLHQNQGELLHLRYGARVRVVHLNYCAENRYTMTRKADW